MSLAYLRATFVALSLSLGTFASCPDEGAELSFIRTDLEGIFAPLAAGLGGGPVTPTVITLDLNGDGHRDTAIIGTVDPSVTLDHIKSKHLLSFQNALGVGMAETLQERYTLTPLRVLRYQGEPVLYIYLSERTGSCKRVAIVNFMNAGTTTMEVHRGSVKPSGYPHDLPAPPPRLKGDALTFKNSEGTGTLVFLDGKVFRWYPIEAIP